MSLSFGSSKKKSTQTQEQNASSERDPWDEAIPQLRGYLERVGALGPTGETAAQGAAFDTLASRAAQGNPYAGQQAYYASSLYDTVDRAGVVGAAYERLQDQLGGVASGSYLDPMANPEMRGMLDLLGSEAQNRINAQFAGAGRDLSGMNQRAVAEGVARAQGGLLFDQYNLERANQMNAAQALYGAGADSAATAGGLDAQRAAIRGQGASAAADALDAANYGENALLAIEQQRKMLPYEDLGALGSLLFPVAGLGGQETQNASSTGTATEKGSSFGLSGKLLSDERAKEGVEEIGAMADGTPIYRYRYKGDPSGTIHVGPMAQEVDQDAVAADGPGGLLTVDMGAATDDAAAMMRKKRRGGGY